MFVYKFIGPGSKNVNLGFFLFKKFFMSEIRWDSKKMDISLRAIKGVFGIFFTG